MLQRHVYADLGTNWGDTLDLYRGLAAPAHSSASNWEVYGFEAAPMLMPFLDQLVRWKNGVPATSRPAACEPPVGSTSDRKRFAHIVGCERLWLAKMNSCMDSIFRRSSEHQHQEPDMDLLSKPTVLQRLREAGQPARGATTADSGRTRYTFVPAAVGGRAGTIRFGAQRAPPRASTSHTFSQGSLMHMASRSSASVDVQIVGARIAASRP